MTKNSNTLKVGDRLFYDTATITSITKDKIEYKCDVCGEHREFHKSSYDIGNINMCIVCKYGKTAGVTKKLMNQNKRKIENTIKKRKELKKKEEYNRLNKGRLKVIDEGDEIDYIVQCKECEKQYKYRKDIFDKAKSPICLKCSTRGGFINREGKTFKNLIITRELGGGNIECLCSNCGATDEYNKNKVVNGTVKCRACKDDEVRVSDLIGTIVNTLYVIREQPNNGNKVKTYCLICGEINIVNSGDILNNTAKCKCEDTDKLLVCRYCGKKTYRLNIKDNIAKCENELCPGNLGFHIKDFNEEVKINMNTGLYIITCRELYNKSPNRTVFDLRRDSQGNRCLIVYDRAVYVGRNHRKYFRVYCLQHKRYILLSENEIGDLEDNQPLKYNHELCDCEYDMDINYTK